MKTVKTERILIVENEKVLSNFLIDTLRKDGYSVCAVKKVEDTAAELKKNSYDLIIIEINPHTNGEIDLLGKIKKQFPEIFILLVSDHVSSEIALSAIKHGVSDFSVKPYTLDEIRTAIEKIFHRLRLLKENVRLKETMHLFEISNALNKTIDMESLLHLILRSALAQTEATRGSLMLVDESGKELHIKASVGIDDEIVKKTRIKIGESIAGKVARDEKPLLVTDVSEHPLLQKLSHKFFDSSFISVPLIESKNEEFLYFPLKTKKNIIGVLNVNKQIRGRAFTEGDIHLLSILASQAAVSIENARLFKNLEETYLNTMQSLALILEGKSSYTRGHSERVTEYALGIGEKLQLTSEEIKTIKYGAILHDIGKIGINDRILNKQGELTAAEYETIKQHPAIGYDMLRPIKFMQKAMPIIRSHHERIDGRGFPDGIKKGNLPLLVRISVVADAYDAMTSNRPYRKALSRKTAFLELEKNINTQFDEEVVNAIITLLSPE